MAQGFKAKLASRIHTVQVEGQEIDLTLPEWFPWGKEWRRDMNELVVALSMEGLVYHAASSLVINLREEFSRAWRLASEGKRGYPDKETFAEEEWKPGPPKRVALTRAEKAARELGIDVEDLRAALQAKGIDPDAPAED